MLILFSKTSRGIDCQNVDLVISMDLTDDAETYLHRIGLKIIVKFNVLNLNDEKLI